MHRRPSRPEHPRKRPPALLLAPLLLVLLAPSLQAQQPSGDLKLRIHSISLVIDYGDGAQRHFTAIPLRKDMTVLDALAAAQKHPHGVKFTQRGKGTTALVTQIDDLANQGAGKNWIFSVGGKTAEVGAGAYKLADGDRVLWEFKEYE